MSWRGGIVEKIKWEGLIGIASLGSGMRGLRIIKSNCKDNFKQTFFNHNTLK
jgi:hypothetical protein